MPTKDELRILQKLPLETKVLKTQQRIHEWIRYYGEKNVFVSFSGGKDSTVLLHIVRSLYPEVPGVFVDTGLEFPEIRDFVKKIPNIRILHPDKNYMDVLKDYGYPVISKTVSHNISILSRNPHGKVATNLFNPQKTGPFAMAKWRPLLDLDFQISDKCCDIMKKKPIHDYCKKTNSMPITGQLACESKMRETKWLKNGCNAFDAKNPISNPLSFWTEQDILRYILLHEKDMMELGEISTPIASVYGDVAFDVSKYKYKTTGLCRTGCIFCPFGVHLEKGVTRFQSLKQTHPILYNYCIYGGEYKDGRWLPSIEFESKGLGFGHVFDEINSLYGSDFIRYK